MELKKVGNRGYTTGFALGENKSDSYSYDISKGLAGADFLFEFHGKKKHNEIDFASNSDDNFYFVKVKNKVLLGDEVEIITPKEQFVTKITEILNEKGESMELANTNADVYLKFDKEPLDYSVALARTVGVKEHVS